MSIVSRQAIAAALAREDLSGGERLVAFSLASYAGRDGRAWPGAPAAAARAGLSRSRYLHDRDRLVRRGLVVMEEVASGRGRASTVALSFATKGPWWEGEINAELFEAVLSRTGTRGPARLVLAVMAALADLEGVVRGVSNGELCAAAGVDDRTYRRAKPGLLASGELVLMSGAVGRGNTNVWQVRMSAHTPAAHGAGRKRRVVPPAGMRPLLATVTPPAGDVEREGAEQREDPGGRASLAPDRNRPVQTGISAGNGGQDGTVSEENCPVWSGVSPPTDGQGRTLLELPAPENPAENPAEKPAANARAGREPQNPRTTEDPPTPLAGGRSRRSMMVEQSYVTERGRRRRRMVRIDLDQVRRSLGMPIAEDCSDWQRIRELLEAAVGESTFAIWLDQVELIAVDGQRHLVVAVPAATASWTVKRFGRLVAACAERVGRELRFATNPEIQALGGAERRVQQPRQEGRMIFAITNQKGGVGKTTSAANLGVLLARGDRRVLLVDADPQFALTRQLGIEEQSLGVNLVDVLAGRADAEDAIVTDVHGVDVIASARDLAGIELGLVGEFGREQFLRDALASVASGYEHVVIDTPPNLGLLTVNALVVADLVVAPVSAEDEGSLHGIRELRRTVRRLSQRLDRGVLQIVPILTCWAPRRISSGLIERELEYEGLTPAVRVPARSALFARAAASRVPLAVSDPDSAPAVAYRQLAEHLAAVSPR